METDGAREARAVRCFFEGELVGKGTGLVSAGKGRQIKRRTYDLDELPFGFGLAYPGILSRSRSKTM